MALLCIIIPMPAKNPLYQGLFLSIADLRFNYNESFIGNLLEFKYKLLRAAS